MRITDIFNSPRCFGLVAGDIAPNSEGMSGIRGFIIGNIIRIEQNNIFELKEIGVLADRQRQGIGTAMLDELNEQLWRKQISGIFLQTYRDTAAYHFYVGNGFARDQEFCALTRAVLPVDEG